MKVKDFFMLLAILLLAMWLFNTTSEMFKTCSDDAINQGVAQYIFDTPQFVR